MTLLLLDPPGGQLSPLIRTFKSAIGPGCNIELITDAAGMLARIRQQRGYDLVVIDHEAAGALALTSKVHAIDPDVPLVVVAGKGDVRLAARAIEAGASDFLVRGHSLASRVQTLMGKVQKLSRLIGDKQKLLEQNRQMRAADRERYQIVGRSQLVSQLLERIERVAPIPRPVLIRGERGTGKELIGRAIHAAGRPGGPMVVINCAAFNDSLLESELFGHEKGAFTGADRAKPGKFEQASGGTLFLDEIGNMTLHFQQEILRVVEYGTFTRVGGTEEIKTDARIIAATNADLRERMEAGEFLRDLYDRLTFEQIVAPALRDRPEDIEPLAQHFLEQFMREIPHIKGKRLSRDAIECLSAYDFPGNVRELKNIIERAAYRETGDEVRAGDLGLSEVHLGERVGGGFHAQVAAFKLRLVEQALNDCGGNQAAAARQLELSYHQLRYLLRKSS